MHPKQRCTVYGNKFELMLANMTQVLLTLLINGIDYSMTSNTYRINALLKPRYIVQNCLNGLSYKIGCGVKTTL